MVDSLSLDLSLLGTLSARSGSRHKNLCRGSPWFQVHLGSPTALTNWRSSRLSGTVSLSLGAHYRGLGAGPPVTSVVGI